MDKREIANELEESMNSMKLSEETDEAFISLYELWPFGFGVVVIEAIKILREIGAENTNE